MAILPHTAAPTTMLAFARAVVRSLNIAIHAGHYTVADSFKRILPKARELATTVATLPDGVRSNYRVGHTTLSATSPDLPYDALVTYLADNQSKDINCYTSGIINIGTYDKHITFRFKYLVRDAKRCSATPVPVRVCACIFIYMPFTHTILIPLKRAYGDRSPCRESSRATMMRSRTTPSCSTPRTWSWATTWGKLRTCCFSSPPWTP